MVLPPDPRIRSLFPTRLLNIKGQDVIALKHDLNATLYLRSIGHDVPAPVLDQYHWPFPFGQPPYHVQKLTVGMMTTNKRAYNLNGLGTGKTRCTCWSFDYLQRSGAAKKMLVVATLSTVTQVWAKEIFEVFPHMRVQVLTGSKDRRLKRLREDADVYIINHDGVGTIHDELMARTDIDVLAIDEISGFRNANAQRSKTLQKLAATKEWVWGLTGSPMPKCPTDVHGLCRVVTPWTTEKTFNRIRERLCYKAGPWEWKPKDNAVERAFDMLQPSVRYTLDDIVELPELVYQYVEVPLGAKQAKAYQTMKKSCVSLVDGKQIDALNAGAALSKLLQIACGWVYNREGETITLDNEARVEAIVSAVQEAAHKVIIFVPFKSVLKGISEALTTAKIEHDTVSGDTSKGKRDEIFTAFQKSTKYKAIVAHPACMAHGLTLTQADTIVWAGPVTDLEIFMQANGRITRLGQKHKQLVLMIGGTAAEKRIYTALGNKESVQSQFLDLIAGASE